MAHPAPEAPPAPALADAAPVPLWLAGVDGGRTWFNRAWLRFTGRTADAERGDGWLASVHPDDRDAVATAYRRAIAEREPFELKHRLRRHDGTYRWVLHRGAPRYDAGGALTGYVGTGVDVTGVYEAAAPLHEYEMRFAAQAGRERDAALAQLGALLHHAPVGFAFLDRRHRFARANDALAQITGLPAAAHVGRLIEEVVPAHDPPLRPLLERVFETDQPIEQIEVSGETRREPGVHRHWLVSLYPVRPPSGPTQWVGATFVEVTERKRAEATLAQANAALEGRVQAQTAELAAAEEEGRRSEERFRSLFVASPDAIFVESEDGVVLDANPAACRLHRTDRASLIGRRVADLVPEAYRSRSQDDFVGLMTGALETLESYSLTADGEPVPVEVRASRVRYGGRPAVLLHVRDVTERRRQQALIERSERLLAGVLTASLDGIAALEAVRDASGAVVDFRWLTVNPSAAALYGLPADALIDARLSEWRPAAFGPRLFERFVEVVETGAPFRDELQTGTGGPPTWLSITVVRLDDGITLTTRDVTEQKAAERALRESEERFAKAFHAAPVAISISTEAEGQFLAVNEHFLRLTGYEHAEVVGHTTAELRLYPDPGGRARLLERIRRQGRLYDVEHPIRTRSGELRDTLYSFELIEIAGRPCILAIGHDVTDRKRLEREVIEATEIERRRIGQDLHDGLGQQLTGAAFLARGLQQRLERAGAAEAADAAYLADLLAETLGEARGLSRILSPVDIESDGLADALHGLAEQTSRTFDVPCQLTTVGDVRLDDNAAASHLFRIAQEAVNNALKHAAPSTVSVVLERKPGALVLRVHDDGRGLPPAPTDGGIGLRTMRYRADLIGADLAIRPDRAGGTVVACRVPLDGDGA